MATRKRREHRERRNELSATITLDERTLLEAIEQVIDEMDVESMVDAEIKRSTDEATDRFDLEETVMNKVEGMMNNPCEEGLTLLDDAVESALYRLKIDSRKRRWQFLPHVLREFFWPTHKEPKHEPRTR